MSKRHSQFVEAVNALMASQNLTWDAAWNEVRRRQPELYRGMTAAVNELPPKSEVSADGQRLTPDWPVPPQILAALGLPTSATEKQFRVWKLAEQVKSIEPEIAAKILVTLVRFQQLTQGSKFDQTWAALERHFPDLFAALDRIGPAASKPAQEAANEAAGADIRMGIGPVQYAAVRKS